MVSRATIRTTVVAFAAGLGVTACGAEPNEQPAESDSGMETALPLGTDATVVQMTGFAEPEAVRYDPQRDVYYISNFNGDGGDRDGNGFISRATADGEVTDLEYLTGTDEYPLHAPRGMNIENDVLWVADVDGVHAFDLESGTQQAFHDLSEYEPGFLNDIGVDGSGTVYVTDTGRPRVYAITGDEATIAVEDSALGPANGVTWDATGGRFVFAPWHGVNTLASWTPGPDGGSMGTLGQIDAGYFDGIEPFADGFLVAAQSDSSIYFINGGQAERWVSVAGNPADIAVDTRRGRVAVPYISMNRVDIWDLPQR